MLGETIEIKLNTAQFNELIKKGYSLDMIFILRLLETTDETYPVSPKIENIVQSMRRKQLITDEDSLTDEGKELLKFLSSVTDSPKIPRKKTIKVDDAFDKWWKAYPPTDTFTANNRTFKGTRALRVKKEDCRVKIHKILAAGEYTIDDLIGALELEVTQKVENSLKTGSNKMSFMQNSLTYLNQCTYEPFIELLKAGHKIEKAKTAPTGGVEI